MTSCESKKSFVTGDLQTSYNTFSHIFLLQNNKINSFSCI